MRYKYIAAWGVWRADRKQITLKNIERAEKENAPEDSVYFDSDTMKWVTINEVVSPPCRKFLEEQGKTYE